MASSKKFIRKVEDFICEKCGNPVKGDGYTNHCPKCLFSKHVDINPGDRLDTCGGLMAPIAVESRKEGYYLTQRCQSCGAQRNIKVRKEDDFDVVVAIAQKKAASYLK